MQSAGTARPLAVPPEGYRSSASVGFRRPAGGFFLWLDVGNGEEAALTLWKDAAIRVLPGAYMSETMADGGNFYD